MKAQHVTDFYPFRNRFSRWASSRIVEQHHTLGQSSFGSRTHCDWAIDKRDSYRGRWVGMISSHFHDRLTCPLASDHSLLSRIPQKLTIKSEQWEANGHAMGLPLEYFVFKRKYGKSDLLGIQNVPLSHSMLSRWFENSKNVALVFHQFAPYKREIFWGFSKHCGICIFFENGNLLWHSKHRLEKENVVLWAIFSSICSKFPLVHSSCGSFYFCAQISFRRH